MNSTLTRNLVWPTLINFHTNFPPTLIGLFSEVPSVIARQDRDSCVAGHRDSLLLRLQLAPLRLLTDFIRLLHAHKIGETLGRRAQSVEFLLFFLLENTAPFVCSRFKFSNSLHRVQLLLDFVSTVCY
jgi:hypothetical protein